MSQYYDFTQVEDLREFIMGILDGYVPTQLNDFPKTTVDQAFENLRFEDWSLSNVSGNNLYVECVGITNLELDDAVRAAIRDLLDDNDTLTQDEIELLESTLYDLENGGYWNILTCYPNGSLDSSVYINSYNGGLSKEQLETLRIVNEKTDAIRDVLDTLNCDVENLEEVLDIENEMEQKKEDIGR